MSLAIDAALAFLVQQHYADQANHEPEVTIQVIPRPDKPAKVAKAQAKTDRAAIEQAHRDANPAPKPAPAWAMVMMPEKNSLTAQEFLLAMRDAGKRPFEVVNPATGVSRTIVKVESSKVRSDQIQALAAYDGYDPKADFGGQVYRATAKANNAIHGSDLHGPTREEARNATRSLKGFVRGMPDNKQTKLDHLLAKERQCAEDMARHEHEAASLPYGDERSLKVGLAKVEAERLGEIRKAISEVL